MEATLRAKFSQATVQAKKYTKIAVEHTASASTSAAHSAQKTVLGSDTLHGQSAPLAGVPHPLGPRDFDQLPEHSRGIIEAKYRIVSKAAAEARSICNGEPLESAPFKDAYDGLTSKAFVKLGGGTVAIAKHVTDLVKQAKSVVSRHAYLDKTVKSYRDSGYLTTARDAELVGARLEAYTSAGSIPDSVIEQTGEARNEHARAQNIAVDVSESKHIVAQAIHGFGKYGEADMQNTMVHLRNLFRLNPKFAGTYKAHLANELRKATDIVNGRIVSLEQQKDQHVSAEVLAPARHHLLRRLNQLELAESSPHALLPPETADRLRVKLNLVFDDNPFAEHEPQYRN